MQTFPVSNSFSKFHFYSNHNCSNMVATIQIASRFCEQVGEYQFFLTNTWLPAGCGLGLECQKLYKITFQHHTQCTQTHTQIDLDYWYSIQYFQALLEHMSFTCSVKPLLSSCFLCSLLIPCVRPYDINSPLKA